MDVKLIDPFIESFMTTMPQLGFDNIAKGELSTKANELIFSGVVVIVGIVGALKGNVVYCIDLEHAKEIASTMMMGMPFEEFDEMAQSALSELTNMLTATAATNFSETGIILDISTPTLLYGQNISVKMSSNQIMSIQLFVNEKPVEINIAVEK